MLCPNPDRRRGFTLFELIIVMIIMVIVAAMVVPSVSSASDSSQALAAVRIVSADLEYAQSVAVTYRKKVTVTFDPPNDTYEVKDPDGYVTHPVRKDDFKVDLDSTGGTDLADLVSAEFGTAKAKVVTFDETGMPNESGTIKIKAGDVMYTISVVAAPGRVKVAQP